MDYIPPHVDMNTPNVAEDNLTPDLTRICPICFNKWTGISAQLVYHILQKHSEYLIKPDEHNQSSTDLTNDYNEYTFTLLDRGDNSENKSNLEESNEIVKIFIEYEKIFVLSVQKFDEASSNCGFNVTANYIGPYLKKIEAMKYTCMLQYNLNNKRCMSSISDVVGETAEFLIEDDMKELKKSISHWPVVIKIQVNVPSKFQKLIDAAKSRLTCFRCTLMMQPPIKQCRYGHIICKNCRQKIETRPICPTCHNESLDFNAKDKLGLEQDMHPGMHLQNRQSCSNNFYTCNSAVVNEVLGTGDKLDIAKKEEVKDVRSDIGHLRLLEEEAMEVVYPCDKDECNLWISCLDLEEHKKECH